MAYTFGAHAGSHAGISLSGVTTTAGASGSILPNFTQPNLNVSGSVTATDVIIDGVSVKSLLATIQDRLCILEPNPDKLAKFEALQDAYNKYKMLEALLNEK